MLLALENSLSELPALEGRFPQVSNIIMTYDPELPPNARVKSVQVCDKPLDMERKYTLATRDYMRRGKDGFSSLTKEAGADAIIDDEGGVLISYVVLFLSFLICSRSFY